MSIPKTGPLKPFVDFTTSKDNNRDEEAAIQPRADGEPLKATLVTDSMRRPEDNLRARTEIARGNIDDLLYLSNSIQGMTLFDPGSCQITWSGTVAAGGDGKVVISSNLYQMPFTTVGKDTNTPPVAGTFGSLTVLRADDAAVITITSVLPSWAGGDRINLTVVGGASLSCVVQGGFDILLTVINGTTTRLQAVTALNNAISTIATATATAGADTDVIKTSQPKKYVAGNWDSEAHVITNANLASFFNVAGNPLKEGDSLCVQYSNLNENGGTGGRRQSTPENTNTTIPASSFFNSRVNPERLHGALPICKVVNNRLWFVGGTIVRPGTPVGLGGNAAANMAYAGGPAWLDGTTNPATTVENQLDKTISDLSVQNSATTSGADKIGAEADGKLLTRGTVASQLRQLSVDKIYGFVYPGFMMYSYINEQLVIGPFDAVINGVHRSTSSPATINGATTGLTKGSWYYVYAYWTGAAVDYEFSTTAPTANRKTKTGDPSRTYLGAFKPTSVNGFLRYFNKRDSHVIHSVSTAAVDQESRRCASPINAALTNPGDLVDFSPQVPPHTELVELSLAINAVSDGEFSVNSAPGSNLYNFTNKTYLNTPGTPPYTTELYVGWVPVSRLNGLQEVSIRVPVGTGNSAIPQVLGYRD